MVLEKENVSRCHNNVIKVTYDEVMTSLKNIAQENKSMGFHQSFIPTIGIKS